MILVPLPLEIANGASLSAALDLGGPRLVGVAMPAAWTAADLTFQVPVNADAETLTWQDLYDDAGDEVTLTVAASRVVLVRNPALFLGVSKLKVRSGTSAAAVNQGAARTLHILAVP